MCDQEGVGPLAHFSGHPTPFYPGQRGGFGTKRMSGANSDAATLAIGGTDRWDYACGLVRSVLISYMEQRREDLRSSWVD